MPPKQIIALATHHHVQLNGHRLNDRFGQVISLIRTVPRADHFGRMDGRSAVIRFHRGYGQVEMEKCRDTQREAL